jgi:hypothetical protein
MSFLAVFSWEEFCRRRKDGAPVDLDALKKIPKGNEPSLFGCPTKSL